VREDDIRGKGLRISFLCILSGESMIEGVETIGGRRFAHRQALSGAADLGRVLKHDRELAIAVFLLSLLVLAAVAGPVIWRTDPVAVDLKSALEPPSMSHPMGTDGVGRDLLARFNKGAQISLAVATFVVAAATLVGGILGLVGGAFGGIVDAIAMRSMDAILAFPALILAMAVTVGLGVGLQTAALGIALSCVPVYARLVRSNVVRIRALPMVEAAVALGASRKRVMFRHILPEATSTLLVMSAAVFGYAITALAALGFVGLGAQIPTPEWGATITEGLQYALTGEWWVAFFPGTGVLLATIGANLLADRLQAHFDSRGPRGGG
jgi:peptide/nickel transport system permease protein